MDEPNNQLINQGTIQGLVNENKGIIIQNFSDQGAKPPDRVFNLPYPRNTLFTGRDDLLAQLHDHFMHMQAAAITQLPAIRGLGSIGKTQVAIEYAYRHQDEYPYVLWANASGDITLNEDFVKIARLLRLPEKDEADQIVVVEAVKNWLAQRDGWLLILDNADDLSIAARYFPPNQRGHILLTTREAATNPLARGFTVEKMSETDGVLFLLRRAALLDDPAALAQVSEIDRTIAAEIVHEMNGLPLALDQAGAYIAETSSSLADYLRAYRRRQASFLARRGRNSQYPASVATTWNMAFEEIKKSDPIAADLLNVLAFLAPDAIPEEMLIDGASELGPQLLQLSHDHTLLNDACATLRRFSLVQRDTTKRQLSIHRLVQTIIQTNMTDEETRRQWAERFVRAVSKAFPDVEDVNNWPRCEIYLPHALACADWIDRYTLELPESARLLNQTAYYLHDHTQYKRAATLYERAIVIKEKVYGSDHPNTAISINNLAIFYFRQGNFPQAESLYKRALTINEKVYGSEHERTAISLNNLGELYRSQGEYQEAKLLFQKVLEIHERIYGLGHERTAISLNNLGELYSDQGEYEEAKPLFLRSLTIRERVFGAEHPTTAIGLNNLAKLYTNQEEYDQAERLFQRALAIREQVLGPKHPDTAQSLNNLAVLYSQQGKYELAKPLYKRASEIVKDCLGPQHPETQKMQDNYQALLDKMKMQQGEDAAYGTIIVMRFVPRQNNETDHRSK